jgi:myotubularin-related protein 1/2
MFYIVDARRQIAATANMASGKGTEDVSAYPHTELIYSDIENIHVMRSSFNALQNINLPKDVISLLAQTGAAVPRAGGRFMPAQPPPEERGAREESDNTDTCFLTNLSDSGWIRHVSQGLKAGSRVAEKLHLSGSSVLVHCSDGWDRTPQICCVAQLILDPFYRTIEGLAVLIEKDWCAFGHKFSERCGQGEDHTSLPDERSPIFVQFLDSVHQMTMQFETAFEYNESCLVFLADHVHSGLFGNFLGNSDKQRKQELFVTERTLSIWEYIDQRKLKFSNPDFVEFALPVWPKYHLRNISFWQRYYCRWDPEAHPNLLSSHPWTDDW